MCSKAVAFAKRLQQTISLKFQDSVQEQNYQKWQKELCMGTRLLYVSLIIVFASLLLIWNEFRMLNAGGRLISKTFVNYIVVVACMVWIFYALLVLVIQRILKRKMNRLIIGTLHFTCLLVIQMGYQQNLERILDYDYLREQNISKLQANKEIVDFRPKEMYFIMMIIYVQLGTAIINSWIPSVFLFIIVSCVQVQSIKRTNENFVIKILSLVVICSAYCLKMRFTETAQRNLFLMKDERDIQQKLAQILNNLPDGIIICDVKKCIYMNKQSEQLLKSVRNGDGGYDPQTLSKISRLLQFKEEWNDVQGMGEEHQFSLFMKDLLESDDDLQHILLDQQ